MPIQYQQRRNVAAPGFLQTGAQDTIQAIAAGQAMRLKDEEEKRRKSLFQVAEQEARMKLEEAESQHARTMGFDRLHDDFITAVNADDPDLQHQYLKQMRSIDPTKAREIGSFYTDNVKQMLGEAYPSIMGSIALPQSDMETKNMQMQKALDIIESYDDMHPAIDHIKGIMNATGEDRDRREMEAVAFLQQLGFGGKPQQEGEDKEGLKIRSEVRQQLRGDVKTITNQAQAVTDNYKKIQGLTGEIKKGNRTATAQALVAIVKLGDPTSTVREGELVTALNAQDPVAAVGDLLSGKGATKDVIDSVLKRIDPLNPNLVNVEDILNTANALVRANVPSIQSRYQEALEIGKENLTERGYGSVFGKTIQDRIDNLETLIQEQTAETEEKTAPAKETAVNKKVYKPSEVQNMPSFATMEEAQAAEANLPAGTKYIRVGNKVLEVY